MSDPVDNSRRMPNIPSRLEIDLTDALGSFGGVLRCETCRRTEDLLSPGKRVVSDGWPKCHGHTMRWWTQRQIDEGLMT